MDEVQFRFANEQTSHGHVEKFSRPVVRCGSTSHSSFGFLTGECSQKFFTRCIFMFFPMEAHCLRLYVCWVSCTRVETQRRR